MVVPPFPPIVGVVGGLILAWGVYLLWPAKSWQAITFCVIGYMIVEIAISDWIGLLPFVWEMANMFGPWFGKAGMILGYAFTSGPPTFFTFGTAFILQNRKKQPKP